MKGLLFALSMMFLGTGTAQQPGKVTTIHTHSGASQTFPAQATTILRSWENAYNDEKNAAKSASLYSVDALMSSSGGSTEGRTNIQQAFQRGIDSGEKILGLSITRAESSGKIGFAAGTYTAIVNGKAHPGHFVTVFEKVDGKWLISAQLAVPLPAGAVTAAEPVRK